MEESMKDAAEFISTNLRLKTLPIAVKFLKDKKDFPEKTRQPSLVLGKKVTICQAVTMARIYGWTIGLTKDDLVCVPAAIAFGFSSAPDSVSPLIRLFCEARYSRNEEAARKEASSIRRAERDEYGAIVLAPLQKGVMEPDTISFYGNPAQMMRLIQAWTYMKGERIRSNFGGKVECTEYLLVPFKEQVPRVAIPGTGDRIFSMTQDEEMIFSLPGKFLPELLQGLKEAGEKVGARYPIPVFLNFQPEFPKNFKELGKELCIL